jgi:hypothetical protein
MIFCAVDICRANKRYPRMEGIGLSSAVTWRFDGNVLLSARTSRLLDALVWKVFGYGYLDKTKGKDCGCVCGPPLVLHRLFEWVGHAEYS